MSLPTATSLRRPKRTGDMTRLQLQAAGRLRHLRALFQFREETGTVHSNPSGSRAAVLDAYGEVTGNVGLRRTARRILCLIDAHADPDDTLTSEQIEALLESARSRGRIMSNPQAGDAVGLTIDELQRLAFNDVVLVMEPIDETDAERKERRAARKREKNRICQLQCRLKNAKAARKGLTNRNVGFGSPGVTPNVGSKRKIETYQYDDRKFQTDISRHAPILNTGVTQPRGRHRPGGGPEAVARALFSGLHDICSIANATGLNRDAVEKALSRMVADGTAQKPRRGFYTLAAEPAREAMGPALMSIEKGSYTGGRLRRRRLESRA